LPALLPSEDSILSSEVKQELLKIYSDLDCELSKMRVQCDACGRCCHLSDWDHELWLTNLEFALLESARGPKHPSRRGVCPYLNEEGLCDARSERALGCRIFHCKAVPEPLHDLYERFLDRIKALAKRYGLPLSYGELLAGLEQETGDAAQTHPKS
jgi:Fe-S-cluster containining protein